MHAPGGDHIAAVAPDIDFLRYTFSGVSHLNDIITKIKVTSPAGFNRYRLRKRAVLSLQCLQTRLAVLAVDIDHEHVGRTCRS